MKENKMQWLIDKVKEGKMETIIAKTGEEKGSIIIPTGGGKSGVVYEDIIRRIQESLLVDDDEKIIFNLSAPILDLEAQFMNDLFDCLKEVFQEEIKDGKFMFFVNSTADGDSYNSEHMHCDVNRFIEIERFKINKNARFALVASCHKSLYKFAEFMDDITSFAKVVCYLDESHLLINDCRDDKKDDEYTTDEKETIETLVEIFKKCNSVYTLTATESASINHLFNEIVGFDKDHHIIEINARELIEKCVILPVCVFVQETVNGITLDMCVRFMEKMKTDNPSIHHKVLVTCRNTDHLVEIEDSLNKLGYKVFSTCSREGAKTNDEEKSFEELDKINFIKTIDDYEGDCFVLHIKRLRQGIDIKSITDVIFYNSTRVNDGVKRTILQTIGRGLRPYSGERGVAIEYRNKKYGNVLLVVGKKDYTTVTRQMANLLIDYYGRKGARVFSCVEAGEGHGEVGLHKSFIDKPGTGIEIYFDDLISILFENLKVNIKKYINENLRETYEMLVTLGYEKETFVEFVDRRVGELKDMFLRLDDEIDLTKLMTDDELMDYVDEVLDCSRTIEAEM